MNSLEDPRALETVADPAALATLALVSVLGLVIALGLYIWYAVALSKLFPRLGAEGWKGWVPVLNEATILSLGGKPGWNAVFLYIPIVQLYGLYVKVVAVHRINERFGRGAGSTVLAILLPPVWATSLVWGAPPYPEGDRLAGIRSASPRRADVSGAGGGRDFLAPPILPPTPVAPSAGAGEQRSFAPPAPGQADGAPASSFSSSPSFAPPAAQPPAPAATSQAPRVADETPAAPQAPSVAQPGGGLIDSVPWMSGGAVPTASAPPPPPAPAPPAERAAPAAQTESPAKAEPLVQSDPATADTVDAPPTRRSLSESVFAAPAQPGPPLGARADHAAQLRPAPAPASGGPGEALSALPSHDDEEFDATIVVSRRRGARRVLVLDDGRRFALSATSIVIGRNPDGQPGEQRLSIPDKTRTLSKTHARLVVQGDEWRLTDLRSTNGVVVVADDGAETLLDPGESVIGAGRFILGEVGMHVAVESAS